MKIVILFGTESGNAEMVAEDLVAELSTDHDVSLEDMAHGDLAVVNAEALHLVVCSTYGDGELPKGAYPFWRALQQQKPDLTGVRYAMFGLGDSGYVYSYSLGSEAIDQALTARGAERVGEYGRHDAAEDGDPGTLASEWAAGVLELVSAQVP